jgi:hypothetical protein
MNFEHVQIPNALDRSIISIKAELFKVRACQRWWRSLDHWAYMIGIIHYFVHHAIGQFLPSKYNTCGHLPAPFVIDGLGFRPETIPKLSRQVGVRLYQLCLLPIVFGGKPKC